MATHSITHALLTPSILESTPHRDLPSLQALIATGEKCEKELVATWGQKRRFFNAYGPMETTIIATIAECANAAENPSIGKAIQNVSAYVLDREGDLAPIGVPGELGIAGIGLARGYYRRASSTAIQFIPNKFDEVVGGRIYCTGDVARYRSDGNIELMGRNDRQIKIFGFRIEPEEIETILRRHTDIEEAVVVAKKYSLIAYITLARPCENLPQKFEAFRAFLTTSVPAYMLPQKFAVLPSFPRTVQNTIDYSALQSMDI